MEKTIQLNKVGRSYPGRGGEGEVIALSNISFQVQAGETVAVVGQSGAGKTTLLQLMAGLDKPSSGTVHIAGHDINTLNDQALSRFRNQTIGFVFQFFNLQPYFTAQENVAFPLLLRGEKKGVAMRRAHELLAAMGLSERTAHFPATLSGGEMQRVAVARALISEPKLILADEPTANLDEDNAHAIIDLLQSSARDRGMSVIVITHDSRISKRFDKILRLQKGKML